MQDTLKRVWKKVLFGVLSAVVIGAGWDCRSVAEEKAVILQAVSKDGNIDLFVRGLGEYDNVTGQAGREPIEVVSSYSDIAMHTIILLDNSLSVTKDSMVKVKEILRQFAEEKKENELVSLAVYGTDIQYLVERESDGAKLTEALESVANEDKDTYLTDVLYDELQKLSNKKEYTRFIVITDGVDNKAIGYTKEELSDYLKENAYPVYSIGCTYKNNEEQLKNLFAISRLTKARYYLLDDYEEYGDIVSSLCEPIVCVEVNIPDALRDGSIKNILLKFEGEEGVEEVSGELTMPFGLKEEEPVAEPVETETPYIEPAPKEESEPLPTQEPIEQPPVEEPQIDWVSIAAIAVMGIALIGLIVFKWKKKGKSREKEKELTAAVVAAPFEEVAEHTVLAEPEVIADEGATVFLNSESEVKYIIVLRDRKNADRIFRYPLLSKVLVGRKYGDGVNIVLNYEGTVSAKHCEISRQGEKFYIRDLHSSNGTFINGVKVEESVEFTSGSNIKLGNLDMTIEIEQVRQ